jgi:hypothetical protein
VEIWVLTTPGMRIEARHRGFERWGWQVQMLREFGQRLALRDPRQPRGIARRQADKRVGVHQVLIKDKITRDIAKAVLSPGLEGMQLRPQRLEKIFVAKALAASVDDQAIAHAQLVVPPGDWPAIRVLLAWDVDLYHALPHDPYGHLSTGGNGQAPTITTTRREHDPSHSADALRGAMMREREPDDTPLVDNEVVDVACGAYLNTPPQHGPKEIARERRPGDPVRLVLVQPRGQGRPVGPLPPRLQRRLTMAQRAGVPNLGAITPTESRIRLMQGVRKAVVERRHAHFVPPGAEGLRREGHTRHQASIRP